jgi:hypothetical protein
VEIWPTNVVVESGGRLVLEVSSGDTAGTGFWGHNDPIDRYGSDKTTRKPDTEDPIS